jgi:hypothetical protein
MRSTSGRDADPFAPIIVTEYEPEGRLHPRRRPESAAFLLRRRRRSLGE